MSKKINLILQNVLNRIKPTREETKIIESSLKKFLAKLRNNIKKLNLDAEVFVGGSFAKKTLIKKDHYDIDIFVRFGKKHKDENISNLTENLLKKMGEVKIVHGSRDYFNIKVNDFLFFEIVPVLKIKTPKDAENITDFSYSHVKYINKKIKSEKILDEIRLAKAFCYATNCYGAESYINGFSGYGLELLVYHYKSFLKFLKEIVKVKDKVVIDIEKLHKNKNFVMINLNSSKLDSPIILIDPTYKQRNVLAALSENTFKKFQKECKDFLKNPSKEMFETKTTDLKKIKKDATAKKLDFILIEIKTEKPEGNVAGSKLLKFYRHLSLEISKYFEIKNKGFNYDKKKSAQYFFVARRKKEILIKGPDEKDKKNSNRFRKKHKNYFVKKGKLYSKEKIDFTLGEFIKNWKNKNKKRMNEMDVSEMNIL